MSHYLTHQMTSLQKQKTQQKIELLFWNNYDSIYNASLVSLVPRLPPLHAIIAGPLNSHSHGKTGGVRVQRSRNNCAHKGGWGGGGGAWERGYYNAMFYKLPVIPCSSARSISKGMRAGVLL